ncbi:MAG: hypothetical protein KatS3mg087_1365 [Patescibacteria group bacterium]|nr:MAG: hypothetical protein KatS3mg087_1365 [Patescibacteria group bacterium]
MPATYIELEESRNLSLSNDSMESSIVLVVCGDFFSTATTEGGFRPSR